MPLSHPSLRRKEQANARRTREGGRWGGGRRWERRHHGREWKLQRSELSSFIGFRCARAPAAGEGIPGDPNALYAETGIPRCRASQKQKSVFTNSDYIMPFMHCGPIMGPARGAKPNVGQYADAPPRAAHSDIFEGPRRYTRRNTPEAIPKPIPIKRKSVSKPIPKPSLAVS